MWECFRLALKAWKTALSKGKMDTPTKNDPNKRRDFFSTSALRAAYDLVSHLGLDELNYLKVAGQSHYDARAYFLYGCADEVLKASTASMRWKEFLSDPEDAKENEKDTERGKHISRIVIEAVYDEQQLWVRKLNEILIDLILFRETNEQEYFRLYLLYRQLEKFSSFQKDLEDFFGHGSGNVNYTISATCSQVSQIQKTLPPEKLWFLRNKNKTPTGLEYGSFQSQRSRLKDAVKIAGADLRLALGISYNRGYSVASRSVHSNIGDPKDKLSLREIDAQIGRIGLISGHIIDQAFRLLEIEPTGTAARLRKAFSSADAGQKAHDNLCKTFEVGDIVFAYGDICVVTEFAKSDFGYTSCKVRYVEDPPLPGMEYDWFSSPYVQILWPKAKGMELVLQKVREHGGQDVAKKLTDEKFAEYIFDALRELHKMGVLRKMMRIRQR